MDRTELVQLHAALEAVISWPDNVRAEVARWLSYDVASNEAPGEKKAKESNSAQDRTAPNGAPKPNGHDPHPPRTAPPIRAATDPNSRTKAPPDNAFNRKTLELKLLASLRERPRLDRRRPRPHRPRHPYDGRQTAGRAGRTRRDREGRRRPMAACGRTRGPYAAVVGDELTDGWAQIRAQRHGAVPGASRWLKSLSSYERKERSEFACARFG